MSFERLAEAGQRLGRRQVVRQIGPDPRTDNRQRPVGRWRRLSAWLQSQSKKKTSSAKN